MNPWKDIAPYKTSDAANFKGRDEDIKKFSRILQQNDFSVLYAESGIGKTSFINAGIIPAFADSEYYFVRIEFPLEVLASKTVSQDVLIANLEGWLCSKIFNEKIVESRLKSGLSTFTSLSDDAKLKNNLWWRLHAYEYIKDEKVVKPFIIFDQFEEIFQKASNEILKELFSILDSISGHIPPTNILKKLEEYEAQGIYIPLDNIIDFKVLFSMRKEYLAEFDYWTNDIFSNTQLLQSRMILLPFTRSQAEEVITGQVVEGKIVDSLTDIKDDILKLFEERAQTTTVHNRDKHVYEAFLLSVVCSRLHSIATNKQTAKLVKENIANIELKELILKFYNESVGDIVPQRHLKIIENELVDNSGGRNRVKPTTDNLLSIRFQQRYLPKLKERHIVKSADGYVELIHDRVADAVFYKRKENNRKIWFVLQRVFLLLAILCMTAGAIRLCWSTPFLTNYGSREIIYRETISYPEDAGIHNFFKIHAEKLILNNDKFSIDTFKGDFPRNIKQLEITGEKPIKADVGYISLPDLTELTLSDSITELSGRITSSNLHHLRLPYNIYVGGIKPSFFKGNDSLEIEVPESAKNRYVWENRILWDIKNKAIIYAQAGADTLLCFPVQLYDCDKLKYNYRNFRNAKDEKAIIEVEGRSIKSAELFYNTEIDLSGSEYDSITVIESKAFYNFRNLKSVKLPRNLVEIGWGAFSGCSSLQDVEFPASLRKIEAEAFAECKNLTCISLPDTLDLEGYAFAGCSRLKNVQLPDSIKLDTHIKLAGNYDDAFCSQFTGCDSIEKFTFSPQSSFCEKGGIIFYNDKPCFFIPQKDITYNSTSIETRNGIVTYSFDIEVNNKPYTIRQDIFVTGNKRHDARIGYWGVPIIHNPDSVEYISVDKGLIFANYSKLRELHIGNIGQRKPEIYLPEIHKAQVTLYVPYGCKEYYSGPQYARFKEIKEDPWFTRLAFVWKDMLNLTLNQSTALYILCIGTIIICFIAIFRIHRKGLLKKNEKSRTPFVLNCRCAFFAFIVVLVFAFTWISIYWFIFFLFEKYCHIKELYIYIHIAIFIVSSILAAISTWLLVFNRNIDMWLAIRNAVHQCIVKCRTITIAEIKESIKETRDRLIELSKKWGKILLFIILLSVLGYWFDAEKDSWERNIREAEKYISFEEEEKDYYAKADSLLYNGLPEWKFMLSEEQKDRVKTIYNKLSDKYGISNVKSIEEMQFIQPEHERDVTSVAFSNNDSLIVTGSRDGTAIIWNAITGNSTRRLRGHKSYVISGAFSNNDSLIVTGSWDNTAIIWDAKTGDTIRTLRGHKSFVTSVAFSNNDSLIVTDSWDKTAIIWDAQTGDTIRTLRGHTSVVTSVAFSNNDSLIVTGSRDKTAKIWNAKTGDSIRTLRGHKNDVNSVAFSNNDSLIVTGSRDDTAIIWDAKTGDTIRTLRGHTSVVTSVAFSNNDSLIVTGSWDKTAIIWDAKTGYSIRTLRGHKDDVTSVAFSNNDSLIVTGSEDKTAIIWNAKTGDSIRTLGHTNAKGYMADILLSPKHNLACTFDDIAAIWDAETGDTIRTLRRHKYDVTSVAFSNNGSLIVTGSEDNTAIIWDAKTGDTIRTLRGHKDNVTSAAFSKNDCLIVTGSRDNTVIIWDAKTGDTIRSIPIKNYVRFSAFIQNDKRILLGRLNNIHIFDLDGNEKGTVELKEDIKKIDIDKMLVICDNNWIYDLKAKKYIYNLHCKDIRNISFTEKRDEYLIITENKEVKRIKVLTLNEFIECCHNAITQQGENASNK